MSYLSSPPPLSVCQSIGWFCWRFLPVIAQLFFGEFTLTCLLEGQTLTIKRCCINQTELKQPILTQVNLWTASGNRHHLRSENTVQILQVGEDFYSIDTSSSLLSKFTKKLNKVKFLCAFYCIFPVSYSGTLFQHNTSNTNLSSWQMSNLFFNQCFQLFLTSLTSWGVFTSIRRAHVC